MITIVGMILCTLLAVATIIKSLHLQESKASAQRVILYAMPVVQLGFVGFAFLLIWKYDMSIMYAIITVLAMLFCCIGDCALIKGMAQIKAKAINKERLKMTEERKLAESEYVELLESNIVQAQDLREHFSNELSNLKMHLLEGNYDFSEIENALNAFEDETRSHYCANKIANAIIVLKAKACADAGVLFEFNGVVPTDLNIDDLQICSIFSNLLSNALNAAHTAKDDTQHPYVHLSCSVQGIYLTVKVENSCDGSNKIKPRRHNGNLLREHGWGLEIVDQIAQELGGSFSLKQRFNVVTAMLVLPYVKR